MKELIVPKKLNKGDTVAFISLSGGRAGDGDMLPRYETGKKRFEDTFVAIEHGVPYGSHLAGLHALRSFAAAGIFEKAAGIITGKLDEESRKTLRKVINQEVHREDMIILENVDFVHHTPMTVLPMGALCEVDCEAAIFKILEPGVL